MSARAHPTSPRWRGSGGPSESVRMEVVRHCDDTGWGPGQVRPRHDWGLGCWREAGGMPYPRPGPSLRAHQDVERAFRALLILFDGREHGEHEAGEDQQEPGTREASSAEAVKQPVSQDTKQKPRGAPRTHPTLSPMPLICLVSLKTQSQRGQAQLPGHVRTTARHSSLIGLLVPAAFPNTMLPCSCVFPQSHFHNGSQCLLFRI